MVLVVVPLVLRRDNILPSTSDARSKVNKALMAVGVTIGPVVDAAAMLVLGSAF